MKELCVLCRNNPRFILLSQNNYPVSDEQVWTDILKYTVSQDTDLITLEHHHREQDIRGIPISSYE